MAYAAVISLKQTLHRLLHSSHISSTPKFLQQAHEQTISLQQLLKRLDSCGTKILNAVDDCIIEETHKLEDLLEFHESNHFLAKSEEFASCEESEEIAQGIQSFCDIVGKISEDCVAEIGHPSSEEDDHDDQAVPSDSFDYTYVKYHLTQRMRPNDFGVFQIHGLPGCGATIAAAAIFEDLKHCFDCRARVRVGPTFKRGEILLTLLAQISDHPKEQLPNDDEIGELLYAGLKGRQYLIVIDDIRSFEIWNFLERFFPVQDNGSAVLFTTRGRQNELRRIRNNFLLYNMACRDQDSWWYLFSSALFCPEPCPPELKQAGEKIVENCKSLGIVVLKVLLLLLKPKKTPQCPHYWNQLATDEQNPIFMVDDEFSEVPLLIQIIITFTLLYKLIIINWEGKKILML